MTVCVNSSDITKAIRQPEITANAKYIAAAPALRKRLVQMQREYAASKHKVITEGRDQGTVAFPDADIKFFLTADLDERAKRRQQDLKEKGIKQTIDQVRCDIEKRDKSDQNRTTGPLKPADDAIVIDTTNLTIPQVIQQLIAWIEKKCSKSN